MIKLCIYSDVDYNDIETLIGRYFNIKSIERNCRPFQLNYRYFDVYCIALKCNADRARILTPLARVMQSRPTAVYLFWSQADWDFFTAAFPEYSDEINCINLSDPISTLKLEYIS